MIQNINEINEELQRFIIKVIIPAIVGVSINIAVKMKNNKVTLLSAITSFMIGIGFAFLLNEIIEAQVSREWRIALIGAIAMTGEKIGYWVIYKFNFNNIADKFVNFLINNFKK